MLRTIKPVYKAPKRAITVGVTLVPLRMRVSRTSRKKYHAEFLADSCATDCMVAASELRRIGIKPEGEMIYEMADGSEVAYEFGLARIEFMALVTAGRVIFGPESCEPLLGATAMESAGVVVDPVN